MIEKLDFEFEALVNDVSVLKVKTGIGNAKTQLKIDLPNAFQSCISNQHVRKLTFRFTTEFDDESEINKAGFWFAPDLAQHLIDNVETFFEDILIDTFWAKSLDIACEYTKDHLRKTAKDYIYRESDIKGFFGGPITLREHVICYFRGKKRALPACEHKRLELLEKYKSESVQIDFNERKFWNDYTWSQVKEESNQMLKTFCVTTSTVPQCLVYKNLASADYECHKRPANGKIYRQMDIVVDQCRVCYTNSDQEFKNQEDVVLPNSVFLLVTFRALPDLITRKHKI
jgi:hypothetical protein